MKALRWTQSALALCIMGTLTACGSGSDNSAGEGDIADLPDPTPVVVVPPEESGIVNTPLPMLENFGEYTGFDESDTINFFSNNYKPLTTAEENSEYVDAFPYFYYPTCCFFLEDDPNNGPAVDKTRLAIISDNGDPSLLVSNARFSIGQTLSDMAGDSVADPKKDSTSGSAAAGWGELDLSEPYRISFCVASASGSSSKTQIYIDNNSTKEANSLHGSDSLIFDVPTDALVAGKRVVINVPGDVYLEQDKEPVLDVPELIGTEQSFLQFRVSSGGTAIIDDLLIEKQTEDGQADLLACAPFQPATEPDIPEGLSLFATDAQISVSWESVLGAATYDVAYGIGSDIATATLIEGLEKSGETLTELENGSEYSVWVRAVNNVGPSDWSAPVTATPEAPVGDNCVVTEQVNPSPANGILWNVYDGCTHPGTFGSVVINGSADANFAMDAEEEPFFTTTELGIMNLDTIGTDAKPVGDLADIITGDAATYPKYFTFIARIDTSYAASQGARGFEIETHLGDAGIDGRGPARIKTVLRPDGGKLQMERFLSTLEDDGDEETAEIEMDMTDGFHTYQVTFAVNDPASAGTDYITATVYRDGEEKGSFVGNGREGGSSSSQMRIGEGSSSAFFADVDWIVWSDSATAAGLTAEQLVGELPSDIGDLDVYAGEGQEPEVDPNLVLSENFDAASDGDGSSSSLFTAAYKGISSNPTLPFYNANNGASRVAVTSGALTFYNARFTLGDPDGADKTTTDLDTTTRGDIDLSKPYIIRFDVVTNDHAADDDGKCQVYIDNDGTSSDQSIHGGDSKVFEKLVGVISDGDSATGSVTITVSPDETTGYLVGTETSFIQFRCDSRVDTPVAIDNLVIQYQE
ncbi:fibronectin type III domain-containing protein [Microbulbifer aggregans]|uniref:fibronectin type III domain-containing protein n=1 Tax=Microbulbifer aggregans TaxID=1769779 RepID=UPI001CFD7FC7|nr:fibronectin type III domain-containing protein [Microbulbifer aggregans]